MDLFVILAFIFCLHQTPSGAVSNQTLAKGLFDSLLTDYDVSLIPLCTFDDKVTLNIDLALRQIMELNEREQILTTNVWLRMRWNDCRLQWDPTSYNNLTYVMMTYGDVWTPDVTLYDSAAEEVMFPGGEDYRAYVSSSGDVTYNFPTVTKSICRVNVKYFPFDTQECSLQFGSWSHHGLDLDFVNRNSAGDLDTYIENTEWSVLRIPVERHELFYNCCPEPYPDVTFTIVMKRRPAFYLLTMMFPCILTSCVAALAFLLPVESGEKVSLEITVLLSLAVFLLLVSESLPPSSDDFPIIGSYFASSMVLVSLSLLQTVVVLNVFYRGTNGRRVPRWAKVVFHQYIGRVLCIPSSKVGVDDTPMQEIVNHERHPPEKRSNVEQDDSRLDDTTETKLTNNHITMDNHSPMIKRNGVLPGFVRSNKVDGQMDGSLNLKERYLRRIVSHLEDDQNKEDLGSEWRDISNVLDRLFLVLYILILVITTLSFLLQAV
ncbi:neuronal acetylcholine receptor subunit alpha-10-like [Mya arenaria]|uniref:neuronal acetylcholine receptor subunit alpha-10-like n=1 Tax=Mya arenaria TaxID=6604 RepID=UPI0022E69423|nr:neuronal acetylcholine receptor subunit alpha-10-like [Mya arenaria]